jgi:transposase
LDLSFNDSFNVKTNQCLVLGFKTTSITNKRVLEVLSNRKKDTLKAFLGGLSEDIKHSIKAVAIDLWSTYRSATEIYSLVPDDLNLVIPQDVEGVFLIRVEADEM